MLCQIPGRTVMRKTIIIPVLTIVVSTTVFSDPLSIEQIEEAQMQMLYRISLSAEEYGKANHIDPEIISNCKSELYSHTSGQPKKNQAPFGIEKNETITSEKLEKMLSVRESYERTLLKMCLKKATRRK